MEEEQLSLSSTVLGKRKRFSGKMFLAEIIILILGIAVVTTDILMMVLYYKKLNVTTLVLSIIFVIVIIAVLIQVIIDRRVNHLPEDAIILDERGIHLIHSEKKEDILPLKEIKSVLPKDSFGHLFNSKIDFGSLSFKAENRTITIHFISDYQNVLNKVELSQPDRL